MAVRYSIMSKQWVAGHKQWTVMDWQAGQVLTVTYDELNQEDLPHALKQCLLEDTKGNKKNDFPKQKSAPP